ncbi:MAG: response regulator transcription factor [Proteobacteria bacterium]|jgi:two-component system response regulator QseB|nr:DNA-binding response regulator [Methylibium sp.]MBY0365921.1 response regulator transcription factor [Burkholderiaceae bacterium]MCH8857860.1 response regulator transcription factor [Pseudomonadota bacterium]|mmetsp:Transcript_31895/g.74860  ORF Transcript_31895/g.74860 Transcript_31895/m.74860 type:complete len:228 (+) Transcript_31895:1158-1841(+)
MKLLLVEDDLDVGNGVRMALNDQGVDVVWVRRLAQAVEQLQDETLDMVLLDLGLPDGDGLALVREMRRRARQLPVLVLSARDALEDRLRSLDDGADDYLIKPFALAELLCRVRALARRSGLSGEAEGLRLRGLALHEGTRQVGLHGQPVKLSRSEFDLLALLLKRNGRVLTRQALEEYALRGGTGYDSNALDVHMSNLRRKIGPGFIRTVRGIGYVIDAEPLPAEVA